MDIIIPQPLDRTPCPPGLSGEDGKFRAPAEQNYLKANTDYEAVKAWLDEYHEKKKPDHKQPTWFNYRKEAERLLLWCWLVEKKPLSSLDGLDLGNYLDFLKEPPREWISKRVYRRDDPRWRPICPPRERQRPGEPKLKLEPKQAKGLSPSSRRQARRILKSMFDYLRMNGYLVRNPLDTSVKTRRGIDTGAQTSPSTKTGTERHLSIEAFNFALETNLSATKTAKEVAKTEIPRIEAEIEATRAKLKAAPGDAKDKTRVALKKKLNQQLRELSAARNTVPRLARQRWIILFLYYSGARRSELADAEMGHLVKYELMGKGGKEATRWWWRVNGKGSKFGEVPLPDVAIDALVTYRGSLGLSSHPSDGDKTPLVARLPNKNGQLRKGGKLAPSMIYQEVNDFFKRAAEAAMNSDDPVEREYEANLNIASTHWIRHTYATKMVNSDIPLLHAKANLRHSKLETTTGYLHNEKRDRAKTIDKY